MTATQKRVLVLHNTVVPYRNAIFAEIGRTYDLTVWFTRRSDPARKWATRLDTEHFKYEFLSGAEIGGIVWTAFLWGRLGRGHFDAILYADNFENIPAILELNLYAQLTRTPILAWSEHILTDPDAARLLRASFPTAQYGRLLCSRVIHNVLRRRWYRRASAVISMSGRMSDEELRRVGVGSEKRWTGQQVIPVDGEQDFAGGHAKPPVIGGPGARLTFLYLGYFRPEKNVKALIGAFRKAAGSRHTLVLAGVGPDEPVLRDLAARTPNIHFAGYVSGERKWQLLRDSDFLVLPSLTDPWGLVINEALAVGTAVICSAACAASELVTAENGMVYEGYDEAALTRAIRRVVDDEYLQQRLLRGAATGDVDGRYTDPKAGAAPIMDALEWVLNGASAVARER